jgi:hypothetical protein
MARKTKTIKQAEKQSEKKPAKAPVKKAKKAPAKKAKKQPEKEGQKQDVVQTVNVVVGSTGIRRRTVTRRARKEPIQQVETISAKTLAPVFIQPPVASQQLPYDMQPVGMPIAQPKASEHLYEGIGRKIVQTPAERPEVISDKPRAAVPLKVTKKEMLEETPFVDVLPENPTTSVDSKETVQEGFGVFSSGQPLKDTTIAPKDNEFGVTLAEIDAQPTNYEEDPDRDIMAFVKDIGERKESDMPKKPVGQNVRKNPDPRLVDSFLNYPRNPNDVVGGDRARAIEFIKDKMKYERLNAAMFRAKYINSSKESYARKKQKKQQQKSNIENIN